MKLGNGACSSILHKWPSERGAGVNAAAFLATIGGMTDGQFWAALIIVVIVAFMAGALLAVVWR